MLYVWFSAIGSLLIVLGLYSVLWGKNKEITKKDENGEDIEEAAEKKAEEVKNSELGLHSLMVASNANDEFAAS